MLNQVLERQALEQLGALRYERSEERPGYRKTGYRRLQLYTRIVPLTLRVRQLRNGTFCTEIFTRCQRSEQVPALSLMEMAINGVSSRNVTRTTEELCGTSFIAHSCNMQVSRLLFTRAFKRRFRALPYVPKPISRNWALSEAELPGYFSFKLARDSVMMR